MDIQNRSQLNGLRFFVVRWIRFRFYTYLIKYSRKKKSVEATVLPHPAEAGFAMTACNLYLDNMV